MEMSSLTRDGTAEPVSRDQILRHVLGERNSHFTCSANYEQDWQPYPVDPYSATCDDHTYVLHTHIPYLPVSCFHKNMTCRPYIVVQIYCTSEFIVSLFLF